MKIKFLGTAAAEGWPALFCQCEACKKAKILKGKNIRRRSSCLIENKYLIDFPPDIYAHVLNYELELGEIHNILITHSHEDHFYPGDLFMRKEPFAHMGEKDNYPVTIYGNKDVLDKFNEYGGEAEAGGTLKFNEIKGFESFNIGEDTFHTLLADHKKGEDCLLYVMSIGGKKLLYGHDSGYFPEETWKQLLRFKLDGVILDCTFGPGDSQQGHMGIPAGEKIKKRMIAESIADSNTVFIITHFSHNGGLMHEELEERVKGSDFVVAYDGMEIEI